MERSSQLWSCVQYGAATSTVELPTSELAASRRVCIIGGGVTGLGIAGMLRRKGIPSLVVDRRARLGGIWVDEACTYAGLRIHAPTYYYQFLDDEVDCDIQRTLSTRRSAAEQLDYFESYARRHEILFLGGTEAAHHFSNTVTLMQEGGALPATVEFDWVIDCSCTRPNSGRMRLLPNSRILKPEILGSSRDAHIVVVGAGKSGADAVVYLTEHGFHRLTWICSRKIGFARREELEDRDAFLNGCLHKARTWIAHRSADFLVHDLVTPHEGLDCYKFGIVGGDELRTLRAAHKIYGRVVAVERTAAGARVALSDGRQIAADTVISALGPDPREFVSGALATMQHYGNQPLALDMIDFDGRIMHVRNSHGEAATGASLEGLVIAAVIRGELSRARIDSIRRVRVRLPALIANCLLSDIGTVGGGLPPDDGLLRESYITDLLGYPDQHVFRLLSHSAKRQALAAEALEPAFA